MTDEQNKPVRSRDAQVEALAKAIGPEKVFPLLNEEYQQEIRERAQHHIEEAEARGAEEQRRKDAGEEKDLADWIFKNLVWAFGREDYTFIKVGDSLPDNCMATLGDLIDNHGLRMIDPKTGKAEIANVAALEARIAELEESLTYLEEEARRFAGCYTPHSDGWNTFIIFADKIHARAALTREGGV